MDINSLAASIVSDTTDKDKLEPVDHAKDPATLRKATTNPCTGYVTTAKRRTVPRWSTTPPAVDNRAVVDEQGHPSLRKSSNASAAQVVPFWLGRSKQVAMPQTRRPTLIIGPPAAEYQRSDVRRGKGFTQFGLGFVTRLLRPWRQPTCRRRGSGANPTRPTHMPAGPFDGDREILKSAASGWVA
jgi:hypothetical protein